MKVTVTKKNESVIYNGNIYGHGQSFDVDDVIGKSLIERGYAADAAADAAGEKDSLEAMSYADIKKLAAEKGVAATGKKEEIIARLRAAEEEDESADESNEDETAEEEDESADELPNTAMPE